tara:strand:- start:2496 stop:2906 length:411 start_codon:yes stop_codon:yes gene_type:complete
MSKLTQINIDLAAFAKRIDVGVGIAVEKIGRDLHGKIVKRTPVDTGRARASWDMTINNPSNYVPGEGDTTPEPLPSLDLDGNDQLYIVSNLVYIEPLEHGHSNQAPLGMVRLSVAEIEARIDTILQGLSSEAESAA